MGLDLRSKKKWLKELREINKDFRFRHGAVPRAVTPEGVNLYGRDDFCLVTEQVVAPPVPVSPEQAAQRAIWQKWKAAAQRRKANQSMNLHDYDAD